MAVDGLSGCFYLLEAQDPSAGGGGPVVVMTEG